MKLPWLVFSILRMEMDIHEYLQTIAEYVYSLASWVGQE